MEDVACGRCAYRFRAERGPDAFCPRCGELLGKGAAPGSPGLPESGGLPPAKPKRSARTVVAAVLLGASTVLALLTALVVLNLEDLSRDAAEQSQGSTRVTGQVTDREFEPLAGVNVTVGAANLTTATNAEGRWNLTLPAGVHEVRFAYPAHRTVVMTVYAIAGPVPSPPVVVVLHEGEGERTRNQFDQVPAVGFAVFFALSALVSLLGTVAAARRSRWSVAAVGAVGGIVGGWTLVGALLSLVALVLLATARRDFAA